MRIVRDWGLRIARPVTPIDWSTIEGFVVHHTASPQPDAHHNCTYTVEAIQDYHIRKGYETIAYSWVACAHGYVYLGHGWDSYSQAHGDANRSHLALCFIGDDPKVTPERREVFDWMRKILLMAYQPRAQDVQPHSSVGQTSCPGDRWRTFIQTKEYEEMAFNQRQEELLSALADKALELNVSPEDIVKASIAIKLHKKSHSTAAPPAGASGAHTHE